ncbi:MAG TPA: ABC transporter substrate-binding protein [Methanocorpusculum sp.]|nr:ABC transporter substrate-binding protein [Methanocorpusculum sp.]
MKKYITAAAAVLFLAAVFLSGAAAADDTRTFVDDLGRTVVLPAEIDKVIPSGDLAISVLMSFDPDYLASCGNGLPVNADRYLPEFAALNLPVTGNLFSSSGTVNYEEVMNLAEQGADVYLDVGQAKGDIKASLDAFTEKTGIPAVFISQNSLEEIPASYRKIGALLGDEQRGNELSSYLQDWVSAFRSGMENVQKSSAVQINLIDGNTFYVLGGFSEDGRLGYQSMPVSTLSDNIVTAKTNKGLGDMYGMEEFLRIMLENDPEFIFIRELNDHANYRAFLSNPAFAGLSAVKAGHVYEIPSDCPELWTAMPFSGWGFCGMIWMANIMYPDVFAYSGKEKVQEFYQKMIGYTLSDEEYETLTGGASPAKTPAPLFGVLAGLAAAGVFAVRKLWK